MGAKNAGGGLKFVTFDEQEALLLQTDRTTRLSVQIL